MSSTQPTNSRRGRPRKFDAETEANRAVAEAAPDADLQELEGVITERLRATVDAEAASLPVIELLLVTVKQAAAALQVSERTVHNLIADGRMQSVQIAGTRRVHLDELRRLAAFGTATA